MTRWCIQMQMANATVNLKEWEDDLPAAIQWAQSINAETGKRVWLYDCSGESPRFIMAIPHKPLYT